MTCSSSLSDTVKPLVPDTSVLINLHACSQGVQVFRSIPNKIVVSDVVAAELDHETSHANGDNHFLRNLVSMGLVEVVHLDDQAFRIFEMLTAAPDSLDDGEAATIALASTRDFVPVVDEHKGRRRAAALMNGQAPAWSLDILLHPAVQAGLPDGAYVDAIFQALSEGRMRIDEARCDAVVALIGPDRAVHCPCLPGFKSRRIAWTRRPESLF